MIKTPLFGSWFYVAVHCFIAFMFQMIFNLIMKQNSSVIFCGYLVVLLVIVFDKQSRFIVAFKTDPVGVLNELYKIAFNKGDK